MKKSSILLFCLLIFLTKSMSQSYDVLNYNLNGDWTYGIKIKTTLPYTSSTQMPTIKIEGYGYGAGNPISITLVYYIWDGNFISYSASSSGGITPNIYLSNESGYVSIFLDMRIYYSRFKITAFSKGLSEVASWFTGWSVVDEALGGTNQVLVPYINAFKDQVLISGNLGIGTNAPKKPFHISSSGDTYARIQSTQTDGGSFDLVSGVTLGHKYFGIADPDNSNVIRFYIDNMGKIGIGTFSPSEKLSVNGNISSKKSIVTQVGWSDYVFNEDYKLRSLSEVAQFIKENKHLPEIPSAKEVEKKGLDLGDNQALLLKKIEELTLYLLEQEKVRKEQDSRIRELETRLKNLENMQRQ